MHVYRRTNTCEIPTEIIQLRLDAANEQRLSDQQGLNLTPDQIAKQQAIHLYFMGNESHTALGWFGQEGSTEEHPWFNLDGDVGQLNEIPLLGVEPGELLLNGNFYWFGGHSEDGVLIQDRYHGAVKSSVPTGVEPLRPVMAPTDPRVLFVNSGGRVRATADIDSVWDTVIARRLNANDVLSGQIDIPLDQIRFTTNNSVQPYALDFGAGNSSIHLDVFNENKNATTFNKTSVEDYVISWGRRIDHPNFLPIRRLETEKRIKRDIKDELLSSSGASSGLLRLFTRSTPTISDPVVLPSDLLFVTTGDYIRQLRVSGATIADPFHLLLTGDNTGHSWVREFATQPSERVCSIDDCYLKGEFVRPTYGEGDYAVLIFSEGGRAGLGSREYNEHSNSAWNLLGWDHVTIVPDGNGVVDVNSDLIIVDKHPIVPTTNFGAEVENRIEFRSECCKTIRVPQNHELDLSAFGRGAVGPLQQIAFGGKVQLVFEPGSSIRFPDGQVVDGNDGNETGPILYFTDEAELIFLGHEDRDRERYEDETGMDADRIKIFGKGQIWLNKDARLKIFDRAAVGLEADAQTPHTQLIISLQRQAQMLIGDNTEAGGLFQVGNTTFQEGASIDFLLRLNGNDARFQLDREGFLGLAAGLMNKDGNQNGAGTPGNPDQTAAWQVIGLHNVNKIVLQVINGTLDWSQITDGTSRLASLIAVGNELTEGFSFQLGTPETARVLAGSNMLFVFDASPGLPINVNIHDEALPLNAVLDNTDNGKYTITGADALIRQRLDVPIVNPSNESVVTAIGVIDGVAVIDGISLEGTASDFYKYLSFPSYNTLRIKYVNIGEVSNQELFVDYLNGTVITRRPIFAVFNANGSYTDASLAVEEGVLEPTGADAQGDPQNFVARSL